MSYLIDSHVHIVGNGSSGSGCWIRLKGARYIQALSLLRGIGIKAEALRGDLDRLYIERLLWMIRGSSVDKAVIMAHDHARDEQGRVLEGFNTFYVPNDYVLSLAAEHPEFLAAVSIHPAREDALDELDRTKEMGAVAVKLLPNCQNIFVSDERFRPFWERMAALSLILIAHTGDELSMPVYEPRYQTPAILRLPLECGVTVVAAHCAATSFSGAGLFEEFVSMLEQYPNLYGDTSALNLPLRARFIGRYLEVSSRLVHGSDIPVPVFAPSLALWGAIGVRDALSLARCENPLERDYRLKFRAGFPEGVFTRFSSLLEQCSCREDT